MSCNKLTDIKPSKLPINIEKLDLHDNQPSVVGDFSQHKQVVRLDLKGNEIIRIYDTIVNLSFLEIDTLGEKFFESEHGYTHLKKYNFNTVYLKQPPQEVFERGLKSVHSYFKNMTLSKRVKHLIKR